MDIHPELDLGLVANVGDDTVSVIDLERMTVTGTIAVGGFPLGLAIDTARNLAVVANGEDGTVSVIELGSQAVVATIAVGERPAGVAVNSVTGIGVVTNRGDSNITLIDLETRTVVETIEIEGAFPRGVAIDESRNVAVVTNANSNTVSVIDLERRRLIQTVRVGTAPTGVGIHELTNHAVVSNSGVTQGSTDLGALTTASIVDLAGLKLVEDVPVGSAAFGVDVDEGTQTAVVANFGSNDVTVIRIPNPIPQIGSVEPRTFPVGGGEFTITVRGTGFVPISVVTLNGQALPTSYVSPTELRAVISAELLDELLQVRGTSTGATQGQRVAQTAPIQFIFDVVSGNQSSREPDDPQANRIQPLNSVPILRTITPRDEEVGAPGVTLTLNGNNFNRTSVVNFGGSLHSPLTSTPTQMTVFLPASDLGVAGEVPVTVTNPAPGGGTTPAIQFTVNAQANPVPLITSVDPRSVTAGSAAELLRIEGSGFIPASILSIDQEPLNALITPTSMEVTLPASLLARPGTPAGLISNPTPGGGTASFSISVLTGAPTVDEFSPTTALATRDTPLTVRGTNFQPNSRITADGTRIATTFVSDTELRGVIPGAVIRVPGDFAIGVLTPPPGGGEAIGGNLAVRNPEPVLTGLVPSGATLEELPLRVTLQGRDFLPSSQVHVDGDPVDTSFVSSTRLTFVVPGLDSGLSVIEGLSRSIEITGVGRLSVTVMSPAPGGGTSNAVTFTVGHPEPEVTAVDPTEVRIGGTPPPTIEVLGEGFVAESSVRIDGSGVATTFIDSGRLRIELPSGIAAGLRDVTVFTPGPGGGISGAVELRVRNPVPVLGEVSPSEAFVDEPIELEVTGSGFVEGATINYDGSPLATTFLGESTLTADVTPAAAGEVTISVTNPDPPDAEGIESKPAQPGGGVPAESGAGDYGVEPGSEPGSGRSGRNGEGDRQRIHTGQCTGSGRGGLERGLHRRGRTAVRGAGLRSRGSCAASDEPAVERGWWWQRHVCLYGARAAPGADAQLDDARSVPGSGGCRGDDHTGR